MSAHLDEALAHHRAGRLNNAEVIYRDILRAEPRNADVWQYLGLIAHTRGDLEKAVEHIRGAIAIDAQAAAYHFNLGLVLRALNDVPGAIASYRRAVKLSPELAEAHYNLGNCLRESGDAEGAVAACRRVTILRPTHADAHLNLSRALHAAGRLDAAEGAARRAVILDANSASAHFQLGNILQARGRHAEAEGAYREVLRLDPGVGGLHVNLGNVLVAMGDHARAADSFREAMQRDPGDLQAHFGFIRTRLHQGLREEAVTAVKAAPAGGPADARDFAEIFIAIGSYFQHLLHWDDAVDWFSKAAVAQPEFTTAHFNLGLACQNQGRLEAAATHYARALEIDPGLIEARKNLALVWLMLGRSGDAIAIYREGVKIGPDVPAFQRLLVAATMYDPSWSNEARYVEARRLAELFTKRGSCAATHANRRDPRRRLRVGYLSSDFRDHPIARNIEPLLEHRDRDRFEVIAYAEVARPDATTARIRGLVDGWRPIVDRSDEDVVAQIRSDGIDILVLLAAHLDENRPLICASRPAPVQISFHDVATSGLDQLDYLIGDRVVCPRRGGERFTERVIRLPSIYTHRPLADAPPVASLPSEAAGYVTFGSFNNPSKLNGAVLALWGQILGAVPRSRLLLKFRRWFEAPDLQVRLLTAFSALGIGAERLEFVGADDPLADHLRSYERVDIALDTFPFSGSTTTFEALWMGVPVVTLQGDNMMSRWSASMLRVVGLDDLVADAAQAYVAGAAALAGDPARLKALRSQLRARVMGSPLVDGRLRARQIERVYRAVWARWCASDTTAVVTI
ncbi:MAG TPA: tetratricopeptide repeat protein [Alphaproteobacteria bacterium]